MDAAELAQTIPGFVRRHLEGAQPVEVMPPMEGITGGAWRFRLDSAVALLYIPPTALEHTQLRVTVGLLIDVPYSHEVAEYVNRLNYHELKFGRMFLIGDVPFMGRSGRGPCGIVMQEIIYGASLSMGFLPSMQNLLNITAALTGQADKLTPDLAERFGGRRFEDDEAMFLTHH